MHDISLRECVCFKRGEWCDDGALVLRVRVADAGAPQAGEPDASARVERQRVVLWNYSFCRQQADGVVLSLWRELHPAWAQPGAPRPPARPARPASQHRARRRRISWIIRAAASRAWRLVCSAAAAGSCTARARTSAPASASRASGRPRGPAPAAPAPAFRAARSLHAGQVHRPLPRLPLPMSHDVPGDPVTAQSAPQPRLARSPKPPRALRARWCAP